MKNYAKCEKSNNVIGNELIEIKLDSTTGAVCSIMNRKKNFEYLEELSSSKNFILKVNEKNIDGANCKVKNFECINTDKQSCIKVIYETPLTYKKKKYNIEVITSITINAGKDIFNMNIQINNNEPGTMVKTVRYPYINGVSIPDGSLIFPLWAGVKLKNAAEEIQKFGGFYTIDYPVDLSMGWIEYYNKNNGFYFGSHDKYPSLSRFNIELGRFKKNTKGFNFFFTRYPHTCYSNLWKSRDFCIGVHSGDWHRGADIYREWTDEWMIKPDVPKWIRENPGWISVMIKYQDQRPHLCFKDLAKLFNIGKDMGIPALLLRGWTKFGHDTHYPDYFPMSDYSKGSEVYLAEMVDWIHRQGGTVYAYINSRISSTDYHRYEGEIKGKWEIRDSDGTRCLEYYGDRIYSVLCPSCRQWQNQVMETCIRLAEQYNFDGVHLDQISAVSGKFCYDASHGHVNPADGWVSGYLTMLERIRKSVKKINPDFIMDVEGVCDIYAQYLDIQMARTIEEPIVRPFWELRVGERAPEVYAYTLYEQITNTGMQVVEKSAISRAFVYGIRLLIQFDPDYPQGGGTREWEFMEKVEKDYNLIKDHIKKFTTIWQNGKRFFAYGRFMDDIGLLNKSTALAKIFKSENNLAVTFWNEKKKEQKIDIIINTKDLGITTGKSYQVIDLYTNRAIETKKTDTKQNTINISLDIDAEDIAAVAVEFKKSR